MKRIITSLIFTLIAITSFAQVQWYQATSFASKPAYGEWSAWEKSNVKMYINFSTDEIVIFSPTRQYYQVVDVMSPPYDATGDQVKFKVIDRNGYYGYVRLRGEYNGNCQLYVDFADLSIVYNVVKIE